MFETLRLRKDLVRVPAILAAALTLVLLSAACGGGAESSGGSADGNASEGANGGATAESDEDGARAVAGEVTADSEDGVDIGNQGSDSDGSTNGSASQATLKMKGTAGTAFSGTCEFGEERLDVSGEVPASFDLDLDGQKLECEILKEGEGKLRMDFDVGNSSNVYQTTSTNATIKLTYSEDSGASFSYSSSSTSSSSSSTVTQQNSSVVQQNSSSP